MKMLGIEAKHLKGPWVASLIFLTGLVLLAAGFHQLFYERVFDSEPFGYGIGLICIGALSWYYHHDDLKSRPLVELRIEPQDEPKPDADAYESFLKNEGFVDSDFDEDGK
jgi:hypothetical protein